MNVKGNIATMLRTTRPTFLRHALVPILLAMIGCNPTWTKEGKPSDASMPMPPGARPPSNAAQAQPESTTTQKP